MCAIDASLFLGRKSGGTKSRSILFYARIVMSATAVDVTAMWFTAIVMSTRSIVVSIIAAVTIFTVLRPVAEMTVFGAPVTVVGVVVRASMGPSMIPNRLGAIVARITIVTIVIAVAVVSMMMMGVMIVSQMTMSPTQ